MQDYDIEIPQFVNDLIDDQTFFIALDKPLAALKWQRNIREKIMTLNASPKRCPVAPESKYLNFEVRHLIIGEYRVLFFIEDHIVKLLDFKGCSQNKPE